MNDDSSFDAEEIPPERASELSPAIAFPWPPADSESMLNGFVTTWREATFHPARFFAAMPKTERLGPSLLYFVVLGVLVAAIKLFWSMVLHAPDTDSAMVPTAMSAVNSISPIVGFLISPVIQLIVLFVSAAVTQVMLLLLVANRGPYSRTVRLYCFTFSPAVFTIIPVAGVYIAFIWSLVISVIAVREAHGTTTGRAAAAVILPTVLIGIVLIILIFVMLAGFMMIS